MVVLGTKLHVPAPRPDLVRRPRLTGRLPSTGSVPPRLVLVSAPAGFGKTTLLAEWLTAGDEPPARVAWLSLDEGDNDPRRFLTHLVASVGAGAETATLLETGGELPTEAVLTGLVNDLDQLDGTTVLALDDYHVISEPAVHDAVAFLLEHLPPRASVAMTTRADPPLPLPRLRARGELLELRAADLRFTPAEAGLFLHQVTGLELTRRPGGDARAPAPRAGPRACSSPASPLRGHDDTASASSTPSPGATGSSWTTWWRRCSPANRRTCAGSCSTPRCWAG